MTRMSERSADFTFLMCHSAHHGGNHLIGNARLFEGDEFGGGEPEGACRRGDFFGDNVIAKTGGFEAQNIFVRHAATEALAKATEGQSGSDDFLVRDEEESGGENQERQD
jgi:hypothetical protein